MNVFIADDEIVVRESLRLSPLWGKDFTLVGEASDGELALAMMQDVKPDILITDIMMPFMNGLELSKEAKKLFPWLRIIILSGYDDFSYAKQAIAVGVTEYLLKPVDETELLPVLQKIKNEVEAERRKQHDIQLLKKQQKLTLPLQQEKLLQTFLEMSENKSLEAWVEQAREIKMNWIASHYNLLIFEPLQSEQHTRSYTHAMYLLRKHAESSYGSVFAAEVRGLPCCLVLGDSVEDIQERSYGFAQTIRFEMETLYQSKMLICMGGVVHSLADLSTSLQTAQTLALQMQGQTQIVSASDLIKYENTNKTLTADGNFESQLLYITKGKTKELLSSLIADFDATAENSTIFRNYLYMQVLLSTSHFIRKLGGDPQEVLGYTSNHITIDFNDRSLYDALYTMLDQTIDFRDSHAQLQYSEATRNAIAYIHENYASLDINMRDVAKHVSLSSSHFCTVFSQEVGKTFTEYITDIRLEKAKEMLLNTTLLSQHIAEKVGYSDRHYFSYLFKKHVGLSPTEFRKQAT